MIKKIFSLTKSRNSLSFLSLIIENSTIYHILLQADGIFAVDALLAKPGAYIRDPGKNWTFKFHLK